MAGARRWADGGAESTETPALVSTDWLEKNLTNPQVRVIEVSVNPGVCFGPGDHLLSSTRLVRSFLLGRVPVHIDGAVSIVDATFMSIPGPPQSEPPRWPGHTSVSGGSTSRRWCRLRNTSRAPSLAA